MSSKTKQNHGREAVSSAAVVRQDDVVVGSGVWQSVDSPPEFAGHYLLCFEEIGLHGERHWSSAWYMQTNRNGIYAWFIDDKEMKKFTPVFWAEKPKMPLPEALPNA